MAEVVLYHHAQGLTEGVRAFAEHLRAAGHTVHVPDLYEGRTFATVEEGVDHARELGFGNVLEKGVAAAEGLGEGLVYAGFSLGVMPAQHLAQTVPGAAGALLFHACLPPSEFGDGWPAGVPVQVHGMDRDPWFADEGDLDAARELVASTDDAELFTYPGDAHLFADSSLDAYDDAAATLLMERVLAFLEDLGVTATDVVRACFAAYVDQDREAAERVIGDPFVFTSPYDDHIDRAAWFDQCFPTMERFRRHELLHVTPTGGDDVFVLYEYELESGEVFRNTEVLTVRDGQVVEVQVFFGGRVG